MRTIFAQSLFVYAFFLTIWYVVLYQENKEEVRAYEKVILEYEKIIYERENPPKDFDCVIEREWTYDQWISDKPCPPGTDGPLCHMDESDYQ